MTSRAARRIWAVVPAAGRGARFADSAQSATPKQYIPLLGSTVLEWTLRALLAEPRLQAVVVVLSRDDSHWRSVAARLNSSRLLVAVGGEHRQDSVMNGLKFLEQYANPEDWILVHDAARPCLSAPDLSALIDALTPECDGALLAAPIVDTMKRATAERVETIERQGLWRALTPQAFKFAPLCRALESAVAGGVTVTDEAQALERMGVRPTLVAGSPFNIKVTRVGDLHMATQILSGSQGERMRIGQGTDVHAFGSGDHVVLAGVRIAHSRGVVAHSDGDVIIHALCDAILGALGDGDIGLHFPDSDPKYRGADSRVFLRAVCERMRAAGYSLVNADITVLAEAPRIGPHRAAMAGNLAADLDVVPALINIKATTTEKLGFIGRQEGLAAQASVLLTKSSGGAVP
jgi:2-C-methyl-D-erythritol 4-phosphate cytidylyltransferase/2-C-methyl-D-erythritol 2,4-cyclodiphosphate synthase